MANTMSKYGSNTNRPLSEIVGLSTDTKPTDSIEGIKIQNGSSFRELDTGKKFLFDAENTTWNEVSSGGGGGGSATLIEKSITENGTYNASDDSADGYSKVTVDVAGGGGETFEVEMTLTRVDSSETIVISKPLQETINAIRAGKQIDFSVTFEGRKGTVICYGVWDLQLGTGDNIVMLVYDGIGEIISLYWVDDGNLVGVIQGTTYIVGVTS